MSEPAANHPPTPPAPPPLPPPIASTPASPPSTLSYGGAAPSRWVVVGTYPAGKWHDANRLLGRRGIIGQMRSSPDSPDCDLLVLQTEAEWAREILSPMRQPDQTPPVRTGGFPVALQDAPEPPPLQHASPRGSEPMPLPAPYTGPILPAAPLDDKGLTQRQRNNYAIAIVILWIVLGLLVLLIIIPCLT